MSAVLTEIPNENPSDSVYFTERRLVVVEGRHDQRLIAGLVGHLGLDGFQVHSVNGKTKWNGKISAIMRDDTFLDNVESIGVVRDADDNPSAAWDSCVNALANAGVGTPGSPGELGAVVEGKPRASILIVPGMTGGGAVEELIIPALDVDRMDCVDSYMRCLDGKAASRPTSGKAIVRAFLSGLPEYVHDTRGALDGGYVNFDHVALSTTRDFLLNLASS